MFKYVKDLVFLKQMGRDVDGHLKSLRRIINNERRMRVDFRLIGNSHLNFTYQEGISPLEIPYTLDILEIYDDSLNESNLKEYIISCFNKIEGSAFGSALDSKLSIETKYIWYTTGNNTKFKLNIFININKEDGIYRLEKTKNNEYKFKLILNTKDIYKKEFQINKLNLFEKVRVVFLNKKDKDLRKEELNIHSSLDAYYETINEVYKKFIK